MATNDLRRLRHGQELSQTQLATATGVSQTDISTYENGGGMSVDTAHKLCAALDCTLDELLPAPTTGEAA